MFFNDGIVRFELLDISHAASLIDIFIS